MTVHFSNQCVYRQATEGDVEGVQHCAGAAYEKYVKRIGRKPAPMVADFSAHIESGEVIVAVYGQEIIGYVIAYAKRDVLMLENVAVLPAYSGRGIGAALIALTERQAVTQGLLSVLLYTNEAMTENLSMYPKLGYEECDRRTEDGFKRVFFRKWV